MREFVELLSLRKVEIDKHFRFFRELHDVVLSAGRGAPVDTEHINILKSAFLVHLYNVIESVMSKVVDEVAATAKEHQPHGWVDGLFLAWIRHRASLGAEMAPSERLTKIVEVISEAAGRKALGSTHISKRESNWSDKEIAQIASELMCELTVRSEVERRACVVNFVNDMPPIKYVRHMRNRLAHGNLSFIDAASTLSVDQLRFLQVTVLDYMDDVVDTFNRYLDERKFLRQPAA